MAKQQIEQRLTELQQARPNILARLHQMRGQLSDTEKQLSDAEKDLARLDTTIAELGALLQAWREPEILMPKGDANGDSPSDAALYAIERAAQGRDARKGKRVELAAMNEEKS